GNKETHQHDEDHAAADQEPHVIAQAVAGRVDEIPQQPTDWHHAGQADQADLADRNILLGAWQHGGVARAAHARCRHRRSQAAVAEWPSSPAPTFSTSAHAKPSGYGRSELVTSARRSGIEYITPRMPPSAQIKNDCQYGNASSQFAAPDHQPIMIRPGNTKMI